MNFEEDLENNNNKNINNDFDENFPTMQLIEFPNQDQYCFFDLSEKYN